MYVRFVLALAPFLVCLALSLEPRLWGPRARTAFLTCAALFALSVLVPHFRVWAVIPWLLAGLWLGWKELSWFFSTEAVRDTSTSALLAAALYLPVGAVWALFDQLDYAPLGFPSVIVLLTGVHFHYAGFALPRLTGYLVRRYEGSRILRAAGWGVILGVPLVATGITTSQLRLPAAIEIGCVSVLALSAFVVSLFHFRYSGEWRGLNCFLFALAGVALATGMVLALLYGWREVLALEWVTIPTMIALHGTLNSWGFSLPAFLAWKRVGTEAAR